MVFLFHEIQVNKASLANNISRNKLSEGQMKLKFLSSFLNKRAGKI